MKREINEDKLKRCRDIKNCRMKKFYHDTRKLSHDTSKLSRDKSWQIMKASHDWVCHNKDFDVATNISESETFKAWNMSRHFKTMSRHIVQRLTGQRMEIMSDISKLCRYNDSGGIQCRNVATN